MAECIYKMLGAVNLIADVRTANVTRATTIIFVVKEPGSEKPTYQSDTFPSFRAS